MLDLLNKGQWEEEQLKITPRTNYHRDFSKIGDLKSAFIICFALFGYTYVLDKRLSLVREQIRNYNSKIIDMYWVLSDEKITEKYFVFLVEEPFPAIVVRIDKATVFLPWLEGPENFYQYLKDNFDEDRPFDFKGNFFQWPQTLEMGMDFFYTPQEEKETT